MENERMRNRDEMEAQARVFSSVEDQMEKLFAGKYCGRDLGSVQ